MAIAAIPAGWLAIAPAPGIAQQVLPPDTRPLPALPDRLPEPQEPPLVAPPPGAPPEGQPDIDLTVTISRIDVLGSTVFSEADFAAVTDPFLGTEATLEDLLAIRTAITELYVRSGYTTSGAFLPPQDITAGVIQIQVVEGELERVEINGLQRVRDAYVRDRLARAARTPVNLLDLEAALQLLQQDPLFRRLQAELTAGSTPGRSVLLVDLAEAQAFFVRSQFANDEPPGIGSTRAGVAIEHLNLTGAGDRFLISGDITQGLNRYDAAYTIPVSDRDSTLSFTYSNSRSRVVTDLFEDQNIRSTSFSAGVEYRYPVYRTPSTEFALALGGLVRDSRSFVLGTPTSLSPGSVGGVSKVAALTFAQDWVLRQPTRVVSARSEFSLGLDAFNATVNDNTIDASFLKWVGQFQWVQGLPDDMVFVARTATQLSFDPLLPLEKFSIGGVNTVRGYARNQLTTDNGIYGSIELRIPLADDPGGLGNLAIYPFFDVGTGWDELETIEPNTLVSTGLGLRWDFSPRASLQVDWGIPLNEVEKTGNSSAEEGFTFAFEIRPM
ncbi:MAG: ShlB/FhaC/HecB family hemolysin secretion/activation protein [Cyanobacteria bacterium J06639_1]